MSVYRITGLKAAIDGMTCLREWNIALTGIDTAAVCSASDGAVLRGTGNLDWTGKAVGYGLPSKYPGDIFTFTGSDRAGGGWQSAANGTIVSKVRVVCPIMSGTNIYHEIEFAATGSLTKGSSAATDATNPNPLSSKGLGFNLDSGTVRGVEFWVLEIDGNLTKPSWPSHMEGWPVRDAGNVDAMIQWRQTFDAMSQIPATNTFYNIQPYTSATLYYEMQWGQVLATSVEYPIEGKPPGEAEYIKATCTAMFSGYKDGIKGYLKKPGGTAYWPA